MNMSLALLCVLCPTPHQPHMSVNHMHAVSTAWRVQEGTVSPVTEIIDSYELLCGCWEVNADPL